MINNLQDPNRKPPFANDQLDPETSRGRRVGDIAALRSDDFDRNIWCLLGLPIDIIDLDRAIGKIDSAARTGNRLSFVTPNVNWLVRAAGDRKVRRDLINADLCLIDGSPLVAMAKMLGLPVGMRVAGSDLFEALRRRPAFEGRRLKVFFFGGRDGSAEKAASHVNEEGGGVEAVGWFNPGFGDIEEMSRPETIDMINAAAPDFVVVALGAEKGQAWIARNQSELTAPVVAHLGAVVDFTAGGIARAPKIFQNLGLEWAWRIKEEPALWRRYFNDGLALMSIVWGRLLPQLGLESRNASGQPAKAELIQNTQSVTIRLSGDLLFSSLGPIREAFREASAKGVDVVLDLTETGSFDWAFLGLVLMLEKNIAASNGQICLRGVNQRQMKVFCANNMGYPIENTADEQLAPQSRQGSAA